MSAVANGKEAETLQQPPLASSSSSVSMHISANTKYIISTSGRVTSLKRYKRMLQDILAVDIAYVPISSGDPTDAKIQPAKFANALKGLPCIGGAISRDIKHSIIPFLDKVDDYARAVQSVNTVLVTSDGKLAGYNTDALGFKAAIQGGIQKSTTPIKTAICYGYGGVAFVVVTVLRELGIEVVMAGRNMTTAAVRAEELKTEVWDPSSASPADLFINATPASEHPLEEAPNFLEAIKGCKLAFDHEMPGTYLRQYCAEQKQQGSDLQLILGEDMYYPVSLYIYY